MRVDRRPAFDSVSLSISVQWKGRAKPREGDGKVSAEKAGKRLDCSQKRPEDVPTLDLELEESFLRTSLSTAKFNKQYV